MNDFWSLIIYLVVFFSSILFLFLGVCTSKKNNTDVLLSKIFIFIAFLILVIFTSLRDGVGTDYRMYEILYNRYKDLSIFEFFSYSKEIGFYLSIKFGYIFNSHLFFFAFYSILSSFFIYKIIDRQLNKSTKIMFFILYLLVLYPPGLNIIRQNLSIIIIMYSMEFIIKRDFKWFLFYVVLASLFHSTAILLLPIYLLYGKGDKKDFSSLFNILSIVFGILVVVNLKSMMIFLTQFDVFSRYIMYLTPTVEGANLSFYLYFAMSLFLIFYQKRLIRYSKENSFYLQIFYLGTILMFTGFYSPYIKRIALYLLCSELIIFSRLSNIFKGKNLINTIICLFYFVLFILYYYILGHSDIFPYF